MDTENTPLNHQFADPKTPAQSIKVIGVGGGGNNAVENMYRHGIKDVSFILINTDRQVLDESPVPNKLVIGPGRGAGGRPEKAAKFAEENAEAIADLFDEATDMVFVTAGMGGGTGTGAGPVVARMAKERGILTVGIVTIPFLFEGRKKVLKALDGAAKMAESVDALLVINNERLSEIYPDYDILNAFAKADDTLLTAAQSITEIITVRGIINRDFNDVDTTLREGGTAIISSGYGEGEHRVTRAIDDALHSPLLKNTDILGSKKLLMILWIPDDPKYPFNMSEADELTDFVSSIDSDVDVMWGLYKSPDLENKVKITILASGFDVSVDIDHNGVKKDITEPKTVTRYKEDNAPVAKTPDVDNVIDDVYGPDRHAGFKRAGINIISPDHLDDDETLNSLNSAPGQRHRGLQGRISRPVNNTTSSRRDDHPGRSIDFDDLK